MHKSKKKAVEINKLHSHRHDWIVTFKKPLKEQTFLQQAIDFAEEHDLHLFGQVCRKFFPSDSAFKPWQYDILYYYVAFFYPLNSS
jgi:hypothetical protein